MAVNRSYPRALDLVCFAPPGGRLDALYRAVQVLWSDPSTDAGCPDFELAQLEDVAFDLGLDGKVIGIVRELAELDPIGLDSEERAELSRFLVELGGRYAE